MVVGCIVLFLAIAVLGSIVGSDSDEDPPKKVPTQEQTSGTVSGARADVKIEKCAVSSSTSWPQADLRITNNSSKTSDYWIDIEFLDEKGERIAEGTAAARKLASGQVAKETVTGFTEASGKVVCRITDVTRFAS